MSRRLLLIRVIIVLDAILGIDYVGWRWWHSVHWAAWWIAVPLVLAETYSLIDSLLYGLTMWRLRQRPAPPPPPRDWTVDVFITTYDEPLDLVLATARAAQQITYPHQTWILDDGNRSELRSVAEAEGIGWITRSADWAGMPRHAKAGNLNNALLATEGEFLLILDADQVPKPEILDHTLGYFLDERMALVQTPQWFVNVPPRDPLGSQAPLFYGPIQQGKDGWNAAFFCGSNAVIRREALMQLGVSRYAGEMQVGVHRALKTARTVINRARRELHSEDTHVDAALVRILDDIELARAEVAAGEALFDVTYRFQRRVEQVHRDLIAEDLRIARADLEAIAELEELTGGSDTALAAVDTDALAMIGHADLSPLGAVETVQSLIDAINVDRASEAQPIMPMATISVTEDMATSMRLHGLGWRTAYHDEVLAVGLAPEDLESMLTQRLRWAQGTMQVMFRENPLLQRRLSWPQRLMYAATMWSYLSGFAAVAYIAAPVIYLTLGVLPVHAFSLGFFARLVPFLLINQLLFLIVADGRPTWRGQQYSLALFPVWITSVTSAFGNVFLHRDLGFAVTPKERRASAARWDLVRPQLCAMGLLVLSIVAGCIRVAMGRAHPLGTAFNIAWVIFDLVVFSVIIQAVRYRGYEPEGAP